MVFYFTATGNSKYVAEKIGEEFNERLVDITKALKDEEYEFYIGEGGKQIFVFPVYYFGIPRPVCDFLEKVRFTGGEAEVCGIATYGTYPGAVDRVFKKMLKNKGIDIKGFYKIKMVEDYVMMFHIPLLEEQIMLLRRSDDELAEVIDDIKFNYRISHKASLVMGIASRPVYTLYKLGSKTKKFRVTQKCTSCGKCEEICPSNAIKLKEGVPTWTEKTCAHCSACINRCPSNAIEYGKKTEKRIRYVNPNTKL